MEITRNQLQTGFPFICYGENIALCGQPRREDFQEFELKSWTDVLNLRSQQERENLDPKQFQTEPESSLKFYYFPILKEGLWDKSALKSIHKLLSSAQKKQKFILHCASGTRSSLALLAHLIFSGKNQKQELLKLAHQLNVQNAPILPGFLQFMGQEI